MPTTRNPGRNLGSVTWKVPPGVAPPTGGQSPQPAADLAAYPILTEEVGYPPSPLARGGGGSAPAAGGSGLGPVVTKALQDVLGWKIKANDPKGFVGALGQSFQLSLVEGHVQSTWTARSYAVQSDLSGGITGAQASIYTMAKTLLDQALPLLDGLKALDPAADAEFITSLKEVARSQLTELVNELGCLGGPRVLRVNQYFHSLLGVAFNPVGTSLQWRMPDPGSNPTQPSFTLPFVIPPLLYQPPEAVYGTLGNLRDELGLNSKYSNTVDDEQNVTNFRILSDYIVSLLGSWMSNFGFFVMAGTPFLGTQLVLISRQLSVVSETVDEVRFVLDSVFIGPSERQTLQVNTVPPMFLEDLLSWIQRYVTEEAPGLIQSGGRFALGEEFTNMICQLTTLVGQAQTTTAPPGFTTQRVQRSLGKLSTQLNDLRSTASPVGTPYLAPRP